MIGSAMVDTLVIYRKGMQEKFEENYRRKLITNLALMQTFKLKVI